MGERGDDEYVEYVTARMPVLRRLAYQLSGDTHRADDLVQQTITKLYLHWKRVRNADNIDGYVRTMLVRTFIDERRAPWAGVRLLGTQEADRPAPAPGSTVEDRTVLRAALAQLPRRQRAVLVLRFLCDMSVAETAAALDCSEGTIKSQTSHGLASLRRILGDATFAIVDKGEGARES